MRLFAAKSNFWKADPLCTLLSEVSLIHNKVTLIMHVHIRVHVHVQSTCLSGLDGLLLRA